MGRSGGGAHSKPGRGAGGAGRGSTATLSSRASVRSQGGIVERHRRLAFHQRAADGVQPLDRAPRGRIERHMQRHRQRRRLAASAPAA